MRKITKKLLAAALSTAMVVTSFTGVGAVSAGHDLADGIHQSGAGHFQYHPGLTARRVEGALCAAARRGLCKAHAL